ncbi:MAG: hypothetical protein KDD45_08125 [Bdellovibrionales bacterium]|nr:hypothetical protein [Bdellovibrionales bacterium]
MHQHVDSIDYKKRLKEEIKEYLELRDHIRKHKFKSKDNKNKHSKSEKKIIAGVKLDKITDPKKETANETSI